MLYNSLHSEISYLLRDINAGCINSKMTEKDLLCHLTKISEQMRKLINAIDWNLWIERARNE